MKLRYDETADSLYIDLTDAVAADSHEVIDGIVIDLDTDGHPVGIDIQHASRVADLTRLVSESLPATGS